MLRCDSYFGLSLRSQGPSYAMVNLKGALLELDNADDPTHSHG